LGAFSKARAQVYIIEEKIDDFFENNRGNCDFFIKTIFNVFLIANFFLFEKISIFSKNSKKSRGTRSLQVKSLILGFLGVILLGGFEEQQEESFVESIKSIGGVQRQGNKFIHKFHRFCW
jgi:hypothetical protein